MEPKTKDLFQLLTFGLVVTILGVLIYHHHYDQEEVPGVEVAGDRVSMSASSESLVVEPVKESEVEEEYQPIVGTPGIKQENDSRMTELTIFIIAGFVTIIYICALISD